MIPGTIRAEPFQGLYVIKSNVVEDIRGCTQVIFEEDLASNRNPEEIRNFQVKRVLSVNNRKNVVRGIHFAKPDLVESKIVNCTSGIIHDVVVDLRPNSKTYRQNFSISLSEFDGISIFIPPGIGHAYKSKKDASVIHYLINTSFVSDQQNVISPLDPDLNIDWGTSVNILIDRDREGMTINEAEERGLLETPG